MSAPHKSNAEPIFFLLIGIVVLYFGVQTLRSGKASGRGGGVFYRDKNPGAFWFIAVGNFLCGLGLVAFSIISML